ncbi:hypothetical protein AX774_g230 [Zancudomyces culisetae]|uniref:Uncharacterized protein n=1 Tax=Zancudomyces culisetae TaxID=1213189 RepID=A0A1R1PZ29_ZANCU|nr:hypothetical protein AX774_g230 [Zancudomyces culisetae]|eukprot:OMH86203.1 hypothetical protein AX774_g230 [Zancudomyces culisetae]
MTPASLCTSIPNFMLEQNLESKSVLVILSTFVSIIFCIFLTTLPISFFGTRVIATTSLNVRGTFSWRQATNTHAVAIVSIFFPLNTFLSATILSRASPDPPSPIRAIIVSNCGPSKKGLEAAPTRLGSSPSSFAKVLHSDLVSIILSPSTNPQSPQTKSPLANSSIIFGTLDRQSGQVKTTFKCRSATVILWIVEPSISFTTPSAPAVPPAPFAAILSAPLCSALTPSECKVAFPAFKLIFNSYDHSLVRYDCNKNNRFRR